MAAPVTPRNSLRDSLKNSYGPEVVDVHIVSPVSPAPATTAAWAPPTPLSPVWGGDRRASWDEIDIEENQTYQHADEVPCLTEAEREVLERECPPLTIPSRARATARSDHFLDARVETRVRTKEQSDKKRRFWSDKSHRNICFISLAAILFIVIGATVGITLATIRPDTAGDEPGNADGDVSATR